MFQTTHLVHQVHLLSLKKTPGAPHPLAKGGDVLSFTQGFVDPQMSFVIQVSGDFLGILSATVQAGQNELIIWNWKTGERRTVCLSLHTLSFK